ncbi:hypothetical protein LEP1GSC059_0261 [Leptospira noguchii serovar Panama str. CZ214]|uniref:Uncharacterized protein n=1 Tax=Leptospira noguchii serovar Panama str. CZ214 TaxID=1001595 RepID=T0H247_9LEPT|nr:hypothetical protein LEP1GSC059_0261 [Leptospira noguchii serovar Panama str. CZ214]
MPADFTAVLKFKLCFIEKIKYNSIRVSDPVRNSKWKIFLILYKDRIVSIVFL